MKMTKSRVSMAVAAVLSAACLMPATSFGYSVNTQGTLGGTLNTSSGGDALLFPLYTTANGATSSFSVTNTSSTETVATKVRFREQDHCMDVLDFYVILSPNDKFDFTLKMGDNGRPVMSYKDSSCVIGPPQGSEAAESNIEFPGPWTPFVTSNEQMAVGHLEVFGMVNLQGTVMEAQARHNNGVPGSCDALRYVFANPVELNQWNQRVFGAAGNFKSAGNVLVGRYAITIPNEGLEAAGDAIAIRDSNLADPNPGTTNSYVAAHSSQSCSNLSPSNCRTHSKYRWDEEEWSHPHLGELQNLANFEKALGASSIAGDWSNNADNHVGVDWVISFPSRYAYMDYNGSWIMLNHPKGQGTDTTADGIWTTYDRGEYALPTRLHVYDVEERTGSEDIGVSPGNTPTLTIPREVNVFTLRNRGNDTVPSVVQVNSGKYQRQVVDFTLGNAKRGWAKLDIQWPDTNKPAAVTGLIFTTRATEDPNINNMSMTELQKNPGM